MEVGEALEEQWQHLALALVCHTACLIRLTYRLSTPSALSLYAPLLQLNLSLYYLNL